MIVLLAVPTFAQKPSLRLLTPDNHALILIDHQPQMAFATRSIAIVELRNNVTGLAKSAKLLNALYTTTSTPRCEGAQLGAG